MEFPKIRFAAGVLAATLAFACAQPGPTPPVAEKKAQTLEAHGDVRVDDYYWLRERTNPDVLAYLEAENAYTEAVLADTAGLRAELFEELKNRIEPDDSTVPARYKDYYYLTRYEGDLEYPIYCRRKGSPDAPDEVTLDVNKVAEGHDFCSVSDNLVSPDSRLLAWAVDTVGRRKYTIHVTDLATGELLPDVLSEVTGNLAWANDSQTLVLYATGPGDPARVPGMAPPVGHRPFRRRNAVRRDRSHLQRGRVEDPVRKIHSDQLRTDPGVRIPVSGRR